MNINSLGQLRILGLTKEEGDDRWCVQYEIEQPKNLMRFRIEHYQLQKRTPYTTLVEAAKWAHNDLCWEAKRKSMDFYD
jgi:hypothetical protein